VGKFSRDLTALFEQQLEDTPSFFCMQCNVGLEFKIVKNVMEAKTGRAWSLPVVRFGRRTGFDLAAFYERGLEELERCATDLFFIFQLAASVGCTDYGCNVTISKNYK
jgi:hypothetical protein